MATGKKPAADKSRAKKLKVRKETVSDLDAGGKGKKIKGGAINTILFEKTCVACVTK